MRRSKCTIFMCPFLCHCLFVYEILRYFLFSTEQVREYYVAINGIGTWHWPFNDELKTLFFFE